MRYGIYKRNMMGVGMSDASGNTRAHSVEISAHVPAPATSRQTHCSARRYAYDIPLGSRANFFRLTCLGVTQCDFALRYLPGGFASHVVRGGVGYSYSVGSFLV